MKEEEKQKTRDIYIFSPNELTATAINRELKNQGYKYSIVSITKLIDREHLREKRLQRVQKSVNKTIERQISVETKEKLKLLPLLNHTILKIKRVIDSKEYTDTGTLSALGQTLSSLIKSQQLVEGKPTENVVLAGVNYKALKLAQELVRLGKARNIQGIFDVIDEYEKENADNCG